MSSLQWRDYEIQYDEGDAAIVLAHRWHVAARGPELYAEANLRIGVNQWSMILMHRLLTGFPLVDHINGNGLDNRRVNLRSATCAQNSANQRPRGGSSRYKGVTKRKGDRWIAQIAPQGRNVYLGTFVDERSAAMAYDDAARSHYGRFAKLNVDLFPELWVG